jgi:hypothetical protein
MSLQFYHRPPRARIALLEELAKMHGIKVAVVRPGTGDVRGHKADFIIHDEQINFPDPIPLDRPMKSNPTTIRLMAEIAKMAFPMSRANRREVALSFIGAAFCSSGTR